MFATRIVKMVTLETQTVLNLSLHPAAGFQKE